MKLLVFTLFIFPLGIINGIRQIHEGGKLVRPRGKRQMAKPLVVTVAGKVVSAPQLTKANRVRSLKPSNTTGSNFLKEIFGELEQDGLGKTKKRLANNNAPVSL